MIRINLMMNACNTEIGPQDLLKIICPTYKVLNVRLMEHVHLFCHIWYVKYGKLNKLHVFYFQVHIRKRPKFLRKPPEGGGAGTGRSDDTDISARLEPQSDREREDMGGPRVLACYKADGLYYPGKNI